MRTLRRFDAAGFHYSLRLTVMAQDIGRLAESVEFILSQFRPDGLLVEPVYQLGRSRGNESAGTEEFITAFRAAQVAAQAHGRRVRIGVMLDELERLGGGQCATLASESGGRRA